jgi:hypothetical protein
MELWCRLNITSSLLEGLVKHELLCKRTDVKEWLMPGDDDVPALPDGYVMSFAHFHEHGFTVPPHRFF